MRIAVIGGTAAGPAAAAEAARAPSRPEVVLFEAGPRISVSACEIPYFVDGRVPSTTDLQALTPDEFEATRGATVRTGHRVTAIEPARGRLVVDALDFGSRHEERFDRFILATGARARRLGLDGDDAPGVFTVRDVDDALGIKGWLDAEPVRHAVVVGAGFVGVEMAEALRNRGVRVTLLEPAGRVLPGTLDRAMVGPLHDALRRHGVTLRCEAVTAFVRSGPDGRVNAVRTDRGELIGCQLVLVAVGVEPRTELARAAGLALGPSGGLAVDEQMRTSARHVWACGDVAEVAHVVSGRPVLWPLAPTGRRTARVAARNAARRGGAPEVFRGVTGAIAVKAFGLEAAAVGLREDAARAAGFDAVAAQVTHWSRVRMYPGAQPLHVRLVAERGTGRLLGGELVGAEGAALRADVLVPLVRQGATARELAEDLDLVYNPPVAPAVDPLKIAAAQVLRALGARD